MSDSLSFEELNRRAEEAAYALVYISHLLSLKERYPGVKVISESYLEEAFRNHIHENYRDVSRRSSEANALRDTDKG